MLRVVGSPQTLWQAPMPRRLAVAVTALLALSIPLSTPAWATDFHHTPMSVSKHHHDDDSQDDDSGQDEHRSRDDSDNSDSATLDDPNSSIDSLRDMPAESDNKASRAGTIATGTQRTITARLTGYSWQDNTPPGSATISRPILHAKAGGTGTFTDPTTTAVPGSGGKGMETKAGTRLYVPKLKRYFIVEDSGASKASQPHFDLWVGGQGFSKSASDKCMNSYTGSAQVILNPPSGMPVTRGPLTGSNGCVV